MDWAYICGIFEEKKISIGQRQEGEKKGERIQLKKADLQRKQQEVNGLGFFFPVNGLGLDLSNFWKEKLSFGFWKKESSEKTEMMIV